MKVVYVAHPLGPDGPEREENRRNASRWVAWLAYHFEIAVMADWIILSGEWPESSVLRERGMLIDLELVSRADEVWLVGERVSGGMKQEAGIATVRGIPVRNLTRLGKFSPLSPTDSSDAISEIEAICQIRSRPAHAPHVEGL